MFENISRHGTEPATCSSASSVSSTTEWMGGSSSVQCAMIVSTAIVADA
jgi:hypothetical protein